MLYLFRLRLELLLAEVVDILEECVRRRRGGPLMKHYIIWCRPGERDLLHCHDKYTIYRSGELSQINWTRVDRNDMQLLLAYLILLLVTLSHTHITSSPLMHFCSLNNNHPDNIILCTSGCNSPRVHCMHQTLSQEQQISITLWRRVIYYYGACIHNITSGLNYTKCIILAYNMRNFPLYSQFGRGWLGASCLVFRIGATSSLSCCDIWLFRTVYARK